MGFFITDMAYLLALLLNLAAFLLFAEWLVHSLPGAGLNGIRKLLFEASFPLLRWSDLFLSVTGRAFHSRGLLTGLLLLMIEHYAVPWLVILSYSLRG